MEVFMISFLVLLIAVFGMAIGVVVVGAVVIVWAGIAFEEKLVEQWYLWKLDSGEEEEQELAAEKLGQMRSSRAIPRLVEILRRAPKHQGAARSVAFSPEGSLALWDAATGELLTTIGHGVRSHYSFKALVRIGRPAVSALRHLLEDKDDGNRTAAAAALNEIDPQEHGGESVLRAIFEVDYFRR